MAILLANGRQYYALPNGQPNVGGKVSTYIAGTTTPQATYTDAGGGTPNANPVILDARGEANIFWNGVYKVTLTDAAGVTIWTADNIDGRTPVVAAALAAYALLAGATFTGAVALNSTLSVAGTSALGAVTTGALVAAGIMDATTPNSGTTGALRLRGNATSGFAYQQIVDATAATQWSYWRYDSAGNGRFSGTLQDSSGREYGSRDIAQRPVAAGPAALVIGDRGGYIYYTGAASTLTIPLNATVAFPYAPNSTIITVINDGSGVLTITRTGGVTMKLGGTGANADRALAVGGEATLVQVAADVWFISGPGVT